VVLCVVRGDFEEKGEGETRKTRRKSYGRDRLHDFEILRF